MNEELLKTIQERLPRVPAIIKSVLAAPGWVTLSEQLTNEMSLTNGQSVDLQLEISFVLLGLMHPDDFQKKVEEGLHLPKEEVNLIVTNVEKKIFAPIRPALVEFFEKEATENAEKSAIATAPSYNIPRRPDVAPENLPTDEEGDSLLPPIPLKFGAEGVSAPAHPFEEKMKKVFTAGQQSLGDLAIEPPSQTSSPTQAPKAPPIFHADPYREPIE